MKKNNKKLIEYLNWGIAGIAFIIPLLMYLTQVKLTDIEMFVMAKQDPMVNDFFSKQRSDVFTIFVIILAIGFILLFFVEKNKLVLSSFYIPMGIYTIMAIISTVSARYLDIFNKYYADLELQVGASSDIVLRGFWERYEGIAVLIGYMLVVFIIMNVLKKDSSAKPILVALGIATIITGLIGVFQFFGLDFFRTMAGKSLIIPDKYAAIRDVLTFNFGKGIIYSTFYNPNYVGSFMGLVFPVFTLLFIANPKSKMKWFWLGASLISFMNLIGSLSFTGMFSTIIAFVFIAGFLNKSLIQYWKPICIYGIVLILTTVTFNISSQSAVAKDFKINNDNSQITPEYKMVDIQNEPGKMTIVGETNSFSIISTEGMFKFLDAKGNELALEVEQADANAPKIYRMVDESLKSFAITFEEESKIIALRQGNHLFRIYVLDGNFYIIGIGGRLYQTTDHPATFGFEGREAFGSSRGYIWSRSLPLLKDSLFVGTGPDTFAIVFPQRGFVDKYNYLFGTEIILDKPHNMYIQTGVNTGVVSLIALLVLFFMYGIQSIIMYANTRVKSQTELLGIGLFGGILAYLISGIGNDSVISVAPVFWVIFGLGIGINAIIKEQNKVNATVVQTNKPTKKAKANA